MAFELDPFSQIYAAIHAIISAEKGLLNLPGNAGEIQPARFVNLLDAVPRVASGKAGAETPDLILTQAAHVLNPHGRDSLTASIIQDYPIATTDSKDYLTRLNRVKWLVFSALAKAPCNLGLNFVTSWQMLAGADSPGTGRHIMAQGRKWNSLTTIRVYADIDRRLIA